jgi:hypothetical protein
VFFQPKNVKAQTFNAKADTAAAKTKAPTRQSQKFFKRQTWVASDDNTAHRVYPDLSRPWGVGGGAGQRTRLRGGQHGQRGGRGKQQPHRLCKTIRIDILNLLALKTIYFDNESPSFIIYISSQKNLRKLKINFKEIGDEKLESFPCKLTRIYKSFGVLNVTSPTASYYNSHGYKHLDASTVIKNVRYPLFARIYNFCVTVLRIRTILDRIRIRFLKTSGSGASSRILTCTKLGPSLFCKIFLCMEICRKKNIHESIKLSKRDP